MVLITFPQSNRRLEVLQSTEADLRTHSHRAMKRESLSVCSLLSGILELIENMVGEGRRHKHGAEVLWKGGSPLSFTSLLLALQNT